MKVVKAQEGTAAEFIKVQEIQGDMGEAERMQLLQQPDGDVILTMYDVGKNQIGSIEFCAGGRYPVIARKLRQLVAELVALYESPWENTSEITAIEPPSKCIICGGVIVQDKIEKARHVAVYDGCHCTGCGIKFKPNLSDLDILFKNLRKLRIIK